MSKPTKEEIKQMLVNLRAFIDDNDDQYASRVAYEIETAVRFVTEDTDWGENDRYSFVSAAIDAADLIRNDT